MTAGFAKDKMEHWHAPNSLEQPTSRGGGRVGSNLYRRSLELCEDFTGLEADTNRYDLLLLVKRAGKAAGFTPRMIQLLDYYMAFTRDIDWKEEGGRPIVYQSLTRTAQDLSISERQIQKLEQQLFAAGALTWNDSGNHRRYGQRDAKTGAILYAYGVDLTPLAYLRPKLETMLHEKQLYDEAWRETKRQISWYRRQIQAMLLEWEREEGACATSWQPFASSYEAIAVQIRTHLRLDQLRSLLAQHKQLHERLLSDLPLSATAEEKAVPAVSKTAKGSSTDEGQFAHNKYTTHEESFDKSKSSPPDSCFQESVPQPPEREGGFRKNGELVKQSSQRTNSSADVILATGLQHITLKQALLACSDRFREHLPLHPRPMNWNDMVEAAYRLRPTLHISQQNWAEACQLLTRTGAAVCLLLTDQAMQRPADPVSKPAAYFRSFVRKAEAGQLRLHSSIFGLVDRAAERAGTAQ